MRLSASETKLFLCDASNPYHTRFLKDDNELWASVGAERCLIREQISRSYGARHATEEASDLQNVAYKNLWV